MQTPLPGALRPPRARAHGNFLTAVLIAAAAAVAGDVEPARAWRVQTGPGLPVFLGAIATAPDGSVFADVGAGRTLAERTIVIERRAAGSGARRWRRELRPPGGGAGASAVLRATPEGDVLGLASSDGTPGRLVAFRVGAGGETQWMREISDERGTAVGGRLAVDGTGRAVVAGGLVPVLGAEAVGTADRFLVAQLDPRTGSERWRYTLRSDVGGLAFVLHLVTTARDDVVAGGPVTTTVSPIPGGAVSAPYHLVGLDGATGVERWRVVLDWVFLPVVVASVGDAVAVAGQVPDLAVPPGQDLRIAVIDVASGAIRWERSIPGQYTVGNRPFAATAVDGDVVVAASDASVVPQFSVRALSLATGDERWRTVVPATLGGSATAVLRAGTGSIVAGEVVGSAKRCRDILLAELAPATGAVLRTRRIDGSAHAASCDVPACDGADCGPFTTLVDEDRLLALAPGRRGRVVVAGDLSMGRRGRHRGLLATFDVK